MATVAPPGLESQHRALRESVGLVDRSDRRMVELRGPEAVDYLQGQVTNDIAGLGPGRGCFALLLNPKGRILADIRVLQRRDDELWLDCDAVALDTLLSELAKYKIGRQVELRDRSAERSLLSLFGPKSRDAISTPVPHEEHAFIEAEIGGAPVTLAATDMGLDLFVPVERVAAVEGALAERGVTRVSAEAAEIRRIENGLPRYGREMTSDNLPAELDLAERAVSFTKGCYVGQEPVARMHYRGHPNRHLRGLELSKPASAGESVRSGEREAGSVASACVSPTFGPIALAVLRREVEPGQQVVVGVEAAPATVVKPPFERG